MVRIRIQRIEECTDSLFSLFPRFAARHPECTVSAMIGIPEIRKLILDFCIRHVLDTADIDLVESSVDFGDDGFRLCNEIDGLTSPCILTDMNGCNFHRSEEGNQRTGALHTGLCDRLIIEFQSIVMKITCLFLSMTDHIDTHPNLQLPVSLRCRYGLVHRLNMRSPAVFRQVMVPNKSVCVE